MPFQPGYDQQEALDLLMLSAQIEDAIAPPIPPPTGWTTVFTSPELGPFQNKWQLSRRNSDGAFAIAIRGTVATAGSILDDLLSLMIAATGRVKIGPQQVDYKFANDAGASVHLGFGLGALLILKDKAAGILAQLQANGVKVGSSVYVTGHSQGAAIATLVRSYLEYDADRPTGLSYKTYVYAQPKPGNVHYAEDFESRFSDLAFRVTNTLDWVPEVPFTLEFIQDIDQPNPISVLGKSQLITLLEAPFNTMRALIAARTQVQLQMHAIALARATASPGAATAAFLSGGIDVPLVATLNFVNTGVDFALFGAPCAGPQCQDAFFEHHATTYYGLLQTQQP